MKKTFLLIVSFFLALLVAAQVENKLQKTLDSLQVAGSFPGLSVAIVYADNTRLALTSGYNDIEQGIALKKTDWFLMGSVGKTYVAAVAMMLIEKKKLRLDDLVSKHLGKLQWYGRLPNASDVTVRMLMNHTSGIMRYEFKEAFTKALTENSDKSWKPKELISYVLDEKPSFAAGQGWEYSDTNYILLGMIIEKITQKKFYKILEQEILIPLQLQQTRPSDQRKLKGLSQGYAGAKNEFGGRDKVLDKNGNFIINPQFEWTGGGLYGTTEDLARWAKQLYEGKVFDSSLLARMLDGVPAKLGKDAKYGLGAIVKPTPLGAAYGHSGFFPGYLTEMFYFPEHRMSIAVQTNSSDFKKIKIGVWKCLIILAQVALANG